MQGVLNLEQLDKKVNNFLERQKTLEELTKEMSDILKSTFPDYARVFQILNIMGENL